MKDRSEWDWHRIQQLFDQGLTKDEIKEKLEIDDEEWTHKMADYDSYAVFPGYPYKGHPMFLKFTQDEIELHAKKSWDYARVGDPLGNFKRVSKWHHFINELYPGFDWHSPAGIAFDWMLKQLETYLWMSSQGYEGELESKDGRLRDVHVYIKLARILEMETDD